MPEPAIPEPLSLAKTAGERIASYQERANVWATVRRDALRELVATDWSLQKIADQLGLSKTRVATISGDRDHDAHLDRDLAQLLANPAGPHRAPDGGTGSPGPTKSTTPPTPTPTHTDSAVISDQDRAELRRLLHLLTRLNLTDQT